MGCDGIWYGMKKEIVGIIQNGKSNGMKIREKNGVLYTAGWE